MMQLEEKKYLDLDLKDQKKQKDFLTRDLGGGAIWDTGCYPVSAVTHITSTIYGNQNINPKILDVSKQIGSTGVDEHSYIKLQFNEINTYIETSINKLLKNNIEIEMKNGKITIMKSLVP